MPRKLILGIVATLGLASVAVLGSSHGLVNNVIEALQNNSVAKELSFGEQNGALIGAKNVPEQTADGNAIRNIPTDDLENSNLRVPEVVLWRAIFSFPAKLENAAEKARNEGQDHSLWTNYFIRQAGLSPEANQLLTEVSSGLSDEIASIDERSRQIIQELRANDHKRKGNGKSIPKIEATNEFIKLQKQKDEVTLRRRDDLKSAMGDRAFAEFNTWVVQEFAKGFEIKKEAGTSTTGEQRTENNGFTPLNAVPQRDMNIVEEQNK